MIYFHTYFFGVPEDAKSYQFKMKLKAEKDGPSLERTAPVTSACYEKFFKLGQPGLIAVLFSEIRELLNINAPNINFLFEVKVFENEWRMV